MLPKGLNLSTKSTIRLIVLSLQATTHFSVPGIRIMSEASYYDAYSMVVEFTSFHYGLVY